MSVNVIQILPQGMIFAADRNITDLDPITDEPIGQREGKKIAKVRERFLVGYVGASKLGGLDSLDYLIDLVESHEPGKSLEEVAQAVRDGVEEQRKADDEGRDQGPRAQIISLAGFIERAAEIVPEVYYISNAWTLDRGEYKQITENFGCSDEVRIKFDNAQISASMLKECLNTMSESNQPFGFQHSVGLEDFVVVDQLVKVSMNVLAQRNNLPHPANLEQWTSQARLSVLVYAAFWQRFYPPNQQAVGGGADVVSLPWP